MTMESLHNLSREELLELVQAQQQQIDLLQQQLATRSLIMDEAGSIAQAAMTLNGVFQASQRAADQYLESAEALKKRKESEYYLRLAQAEQQAQALFLQTEEQCRAMTDHAAQSADYYWVALNQRIEELLSAQMLPQTEIAEPAEEPAEDSFGPDD